MHVIPALDHTHHPNLILDRNYAYFLATVHFTMGTDVSLALQENYTSVVMWYSWKTYFPIRNHGQLIIQPLSSLFVFWDLLQSTHIKSYHLLIHHQPFQRHCILLNTYLHHLSHLAPHPLSLHLNHLILHSILHHLSHTVPLTVIYQPKILLNHRLQVISLLRIHFLHLIWTHAMTSLRSKLVD